MGGVPRSDEDEPEVGREHGCEGEEDLGRGKGSTDLLEDAERRGIKAHDVPSGRDRVAERRADAVGSEEEDVRKETGGDVDGGPSSEDAVRHAGERVFVNVGTKSDGGADSAAQCESHPS